MKTQELVALLKEGKKPLVKLTAELWDESFGQKGMIARVTAASPKPDDTIEITFDYEEHRDHNINLDEPNWYLKDGGTGNAIEAGMYEDGLHEGVYFEQDGDVPVEIAETGPLAKYIAEGSEIPYVEWLEKKLGELVDTNTKVD